MSSNYDSLPEPQQYYSLTDAEGRAWKDTTSYTQGGSKTPTAWSYKTTHLTINVFKCRHTPYYRLTCHQLGFEAYTPVEITAHPMVAAEFAIDFVRTKLNGLLKQL